MQKNKIQKIREALQWGCSDEEACNYADVPLDKFQKYLDVHPRFAKEKIKLQKMPIIFLKKRLFDSIGEIKPETCLKILENQTQKNPPEVDFEEIFALEKFLEKS